MYVYLKNPFWDPLESAQGSPFGTPALECQLENYSLPANIIIFLF